MYRLTTILIFCLFITLCGMGREDVVQRVKGTVTQVTDTNALLQRAAAYRRQSRIDSVQGRYGSAIANFGKYIALRDSLYNERTALKVNSLTAQYESARQAQERVLKEQRLQLQARQERIDQTSHARAQLLRNMAFGGALLLVLILVIAYSRYRIKRRTAFISQQNETNGVVQDVFVDTLNGEQQAPKGEREWLLEEMQQRVKDNLQLVMQVMKTSAASHAVHTTQEERIKTMAFIHEQLFQSANNAVMDMPAYVSELVDSLKASFHDLKDIQFELAIGPVKLPVSQAVPLGLIINEAVTNAIKYAFVEKEGGRILVSLQVMEDAGIKLLISDNGQGLPEGFDQHADTSFGMQLITTLVRQLKGRLHIACNDGVTVEVTFRQKAITTERATIVARS